MEMFFLKSFVHGCKDSVLHDFFPFLITKCGLYYYMTHYLWFARSKVTEWSLGKGGTRFARDEPFLEHIGSCWCSWYHQSSLHWDWEVPSLHQICWGWLPVADWVRLKYSLPINKFASVMIRIASPLYHVCSTSDGLAVWAVELSEQNLVSSLWLDLSLIHIWRCRRRG